jgi:hypothetical protein
MNGDARDDVVLRRYLLGHVAPEVRERIEGRLFSDDKAFWEHLCLVEDELIESYVAGELDSKDVDRFETSFLCTDERHDKLEFARALRAYVAAEEPEPVPARASIWQQLQDMVSVPRWALAGAAAGVIALAFAGGFYSRPATPVAVVTTDVTASVSTGLVRGATAELPRVQLPQDCKLLRLRVEPDEEHPRYAATLYDVSGTELWSQSNLTRSEAGRQTAVALTLPCEMVTAGDYYVTLRAAPPPDASAIKAIAAGSRASFRVLRP